MGLQLDYADPLYSRITAVLPLGPLPFASVSEFVPTYSAADRIMVYAVTGGYPIVLNRFRAALTVDENIEQLLCRYTNLFSWDPSSLFDSLHPQQVEILESIFRAVAGGSHTLGQISETIGLAPSYLHHYLLQMEFVQVLRRQFSLTVRTEERENSPAGRYYFVDQMLHLYHRFIGPELGRRFGSLGDFFWQRNKKELEQFAGETVFRSLCQEWLRLRGENLPFLPDEIGALWTSDAEVDAAAIHWQDQQILLGACAWQESPAGPQTLDELLDKAAHFLPGEGWQSYTVVFSRAGFSQAARELAEERGVLLVELEQIDADLHAHYLQENLE